MRYRLILLTLLLSTAYSAHERRRFMPRTNAQISNKRNYLQEDLPCHDDILTFSNNGEQTVIAMLDKPLDVSEIDFPDVGVIYLDSIAVIGGTEGTDWQCPKRDNVSFANFDEYVSDQDVYDPDTWEEMNPLTAPGFELHMNRVPGAADAVEIFERNPIHLKLFDEFAVREWKDFGREMTTDGFMEKMRTLEGQLTLQLGARMTKEYDIDGIALMRPVSEPIRVGEFAGSYKEYTLGTRNPNMDNNTMKQICGHIHCDSDEAERLPPRCISTFTPKGHCCPVCGALFVLKTYQKTLADLEVLMDKFRSDFVKKNNKKLQEFFHISTERVDESDFEILYQIVLIVKDNATVLDEDRLSATIMMFLTTLGDYWHPTDGFELVELKESARDHSYETSSIILGIIFFLIFSVIATYYFSVDARNQTRFLYHRGRLVVEGLRGGTTPAEVEMEDRGGEQMVSLADLASECESSGANPIYFANRAFSLSSLDKEGTLVDLQQDEHTSEAENEPAKDVDAEGMSCVDLL